MNLYYLIIFIVLFILIIYPYLSKSIPFINSFFSHKKLEKFNSNKKVILSIYTADWCPHCIDFKKNELGNLYNHYKNSKNVMIKNIDCTNDKDNKIKTMSGKPLEGYPSLIINVFDENNNMKEINYDGDRTANEIISFINKLN